MKYDLEIRTKTLFHELNSLGIKFTAVNEIMVGLPGELPRGKFPLVKENSPLGNSPVSFSQVILD